MIKYYLKELEQGMSLKISERWIIWGYDTCEFAAASQNIELDRKSGKDISLCKLSYLVKIPVCTSV